MACLLCWSHGPKHFLSNVHKHMCAHSRLVDNGSCGQSPYDGCTFQVRQVKGGNFQNTYQTRCTRLSTVAFTVPESTVSLTVPELIMVPWHCCHKPPPMALRDSTTSGVPPETC